MRTLTVLFACSILRGAAQEPLKIWGLTPDGGVNNKGTVFSVNGDGTAFTTVLLVH